MTKTQILLNELVYLGMSIQELSKKVMYEFCYGHVKRKYGEKAKLCYMDTDSFELERPLPKDRIKGHWLNEGRVRWKNND